MGPIGNHAAIADYFSRREAAAEPEFIASALNHPRVAAFNRSHINLHAAIWRGALQDVGPGEFCCFVAQGVAGIAVDASRPGFAWKDRQDERVNRLLPGVSHLRLHSDDAAGAHVRRPLIEREGALNDGGTLQHCTACPFNPRARWQPDTPRSQLRIALYRSGYGSDQQVIPEHVLIFDLVSFFGFWPVVVYRPANGNAGVVSLPPSCVDVWNQRVAQLISSAHRLGVLKRIRPDAALRIRVLGGMRPQNWAEDAKLYPSGEQLRRNYSRDVTTDVVTPVAIENVGRGCGEVGLISQRFPHRNRVARKSNLVAVIPQPAPAVKDQRSLAPALHVSKVNVVEPERGIQARHIRSLLLLPIKPPEINSLPLQRIVHELQVVFRKLLVGDVKRNVLLGGGIDSHGARHLRIVLLPWLNARSRMQV